MWGGNGVEDKIVSKIQSINADLVVLTEFKNNESGTIIKNI